MFIPSPTSIPRALLAFVFVWLMFPHQPDVGLGRPKAIEAVAANNSTDDCASHSATICDGAVFGAMLQSIAAMENSRNAVLDSVERVRNDIRANGIRKTVLLRNEAP
jgi:hypothetical protein